MGGLRFWHKPEDMEISEDSDWSRWQSWPHLVIVADQGADGRSAMQALGLVPQLRLNVSAHYDPSHGLWRDILAAIRECGMFQWVLIAMVCINLAHGPEGTDLRYTQLRDSMSHCLRTHSDESCVLFQEYLPDIAEELQGHIPEDDVASSGMSAAAWHWLADHTMFMKKKYKTNLNRFHSFICDGKALLKEWHLRLFQCSYLALEYDMVKSSTLRHKRFISVGGRSDADALVTTGSSSSPAPPIGSWTRSRRRTTCIAC